MTYRRGDAADCIDRPRAERVHDHVEGREIGARQIEQIPNERVFSCAAVFAANDGGYVQTARGGLPDNQASGLAVGANNCDFHDDVPPWGG